MGRRKATIALAIAVGLGVYFYYSSFYEAFVSGLEGHPGLPSCDSSHGESDAKRAFGSSPFAKISGMAMIGMIDVKTISVTAKKVECTATVLLNNAQQGAFNWRLCTLQTKAIHLS